MERRPRRFERESSTVSSRRRVIPALLEGLQERFGKFRKRDRKTTSVAFSNFRDTVKITVDQTTREYLPLLVKALKDVADGVAFLGKFLRENKGEPNPSAKRSRRLGLSSRRKLTTVFYDLARGAAAFAGGLNPSALRPARWRFSDTRFISCRAISRISTKPTRGLQQLDALR